MWTGEDLREAQEWLADRDVVLGALDVFTFGEQLKPIHKLPTLEDAYEVLGGMVVMLREVL